MKKALSIILAAAMLFSCFAMSSGVFAQSIPELTLENKVKITAPKGGDYENEIKVASFTPAKTGCYVFECLTPYKSGNTADGELPGGAIGINESGEGEATQGFMFFSDVSSLSDEEKKALKDSGWDIEHINILKFTAELTAKKTYYITIYQDGTEDYTSEIIAAEHTHTLKKGQEEKVKVNKDGTSDDVGGIYDTCTDWFCAYLDYTTIYPQLEKTSVKNAVYSGKAVKPAVIIKTAQGKKLSKKYYSVTYKNNKKIGKGKAIIKFRNGYTGTVTKSFKINPKATKIKKAIAGKKQIKATYNKTSNVTGYQIQVASNKKFTKNKKTVTVKGAKKTSATVKKLKAGKKYYVRVRTYKTVKGKKYYSSWTKIKTVMPKK